MPRKPIDKSEKNHGGKRLGAGRKPRALSAPAPATTAHTAFHFPHGRATALLGDAFGALEGIVKGVEPASASRVTAARAIIELARLEAAASEASVSRRLLALAEANARNAQDEPDGFGALLN